MRQHQKLIFTAALLATAACTTSSPTLNIRAATTGLAAGENTAFAQLAQARGQLALGSIALALEGFRRAVRLDPSNVEAVVGVAECYDRMGRSDVSRIYYEKALALTPGDQRLYARLITSLDQQGLVADALALRNELARRRTVQDLEQRVSGTAHATNIPPPAHGNGKSDLTISTERAVQALIAMEVRAGDIGAQVPTVTVQLASATMLPAPAAMRLERLNLQEVALVTSSTRPVHVFKAEGSRALQQAHLRAVTRADRPAVISLTVLNAARIDGLAARTRRRFVREGWSQVNIGDAPRVLARTELRFAADTHAEARRLGRKLGVPVRLSPLQSGRITLLLGRDAGKLRLLSS